MRIITILLFFSCFTLSAQLPFSEQQFLARIKTGGVLPENLLSTRTVVFYPYSFTYKELEICQKNFQKTGIDAVAYFESDYVSAGRDPLVKLGDYLSDREISNLIYFQKERNNFRILIAPCNQRADLVEEGQAAWSDENASLQQLLQNLYRTAVSSQKNSNFLINDIPETGFPIDAISGNRNEYFAIDLKVDQLAVPKFGDETMDKALEEIMQSYPYKYTLTDGNLSENELRKQGYLYVLRFVSARNKIARDVLGYKTTRSQTAIVSVAHTDAEPRLKTIHANEIVYKFYFKHIESKNVFLGRKWDADPNWQQALINQIKAYKIEFKLP